MEVDITECRVYIGEEKRRKEEEENKQRDGRERGRES